MPIVSPVVRFCVASTENKPSVMKEAFSKCRTLAGLLNLAPPDRNGLRAGRFSKVTYL